MNEVIKLRTMPEVEEDAAAWIWRLDGEVADATRRDFEDWLRRDSRHRRAFEELAEVWNTLDGLAEAKREEKIATFVDEYRRSVVAAVSQVRGARRRAVVGALAASLLLGCGIFLWSQRDNEAQILSTAIGQQRTVTLADGSTVVLNTNTIVETRLVRAERAITLVKGEASFKVAPDRQRPFTVRAGGNVVRALGTEFNVRMRNDRDVEVTVAEGKVEVESRPDDESAKSADQSRAKRELTAGERLNTGQKSQAIVDLNEAALSKTLAWRDGAIVFDGESLAYAIDELNRYTDTRLIISDNKVHALKVGGRFKAGDVDGFLQALTKALPVTTRRVSDNLVYIDSKR